MKFYHFNTKEVFDNTELEYEDIAFCKETRTIITHGEEYNLYDDVIWNDIPPIYLVLDVGRLSNMKLG